MFGRHFVTVLILTTLLPFAQAQGQEQLFSFDIDIEETAAFVEIDGRHTFTFTFNDMSRDSTMGLTGSPGGTGVAKHATKWSVETESGFMPQGWQVNRPGVTRTWGGESAELEVSVTVKKNVEQSLLKFTLIGTTTYSGGSNEIRTNFTAMTFGKESFNAYLKGTAQLAPREISPIEFDILNGGLLPREFRAELTDNACGLPVAFDSNMVVPAKTTATYSIALQGPEAKFWYSSEICNLNIVVYPMDQPSNTRSLLVNPMITGTYVNPVWIFNSVGVLIAAFVIFILVARRKARIEEEILGRPQKPWQIPVEMVYLEHLQARDPQAYYVVRHYLMEEEYQSSLLWYANFKRATRGTRAKERLVVGQEHKYERFNKRWARKIAAPPKVADRLEAKLQKKLDREGKSGLRKQKRKWKKLTKAMKAAHGKKVEKAEAKWEKQRAKAEKKKQPIPEKPVLADPNYPPEPTGDRLLLEHHKWQKKAIKARTKSTKKVGNLEVKFEKKDAKMLRKVRRKVNKIARKLDDPEFASEHPLLAGES